MLIIGKEKYIVTQIINDNISKEAKSRWSPTKYKHMFRI